MRTLEFYDPGQPRGQDGKWKRWSGVSAVPGQSRTPVARFTVPMDEDWVHGEGFDSPESFLSSWFATPQLPGGHRSEVTEITEDSWETAEKVRGVRGADGYIISGVIVGKSGIVGTFERHVIWDPSVRQLSATHESLFLDEEAQGQGIADAFNANTVGMYQRYGVHEIKVQAASNRENGQIGGYAWARQGFRLSPEGDRQAEVGRMIQTAQFHLQANAQHLGKDATVSIQREISALRKANEAGEDVQPIHVAALGERERRWTATRSSETADHDYDTWIGKEAMMDTTWYGHFVLDPDAPLIGSSTSLEHAASRPAYGTSEALERALKARLGQSYDHYHVDEAAPEWLVAALSGRLELACHAAECRPPTSGGTGGSSPKLSTRDVLRFMFTFKGTGYESRVTIAGQPYETVPGVSRWSVQGSLHNARGTLIGTWSRSLIVDSRTNVTEIHHDTLFIDPKYQGRGIGADFYDRTTSGYKELGISRISVSTTEVGGYAWARQGFRVFGNEAVRQETITDMLDNADSVFHDRVTYDGMDEDTATSIRAEIGALWAANKAGEDVQPSHIAAIGRDHPYETTNDYDTSGGTMTSWVGKSALLGMSWRGYKDIA